MHIGQFEECYYNPYKVIKVLASCGVIGAYVSSTTSCIEWSNPSEKELIIEHIRNEFIELESSATLLKFDARPLCWIIPQRYFEGESIRSVFEESMYKGFKIHPRVHKWDLSDSRVCSLMDEICQCAEEKSFPIFIHTGICDFERPEKFEEWYRRYSRVTFVLAHCKNTNSVIEMFKKYGNVHGDVSFCSLDSFLQISESGFSDRLLFGSDFPVTDYLCGKKTSNTKTLYTEYQELLHIWKRYFFSMGTIEML